MSPFPLPICRLSLALVVFTAVGCGHTTPVRPTPKGQLDAQLHVGGPAVMLGGPIPVPLSTVGASYGLSDRFDLQGHLHVTALFYKVAGLDVGSTFLAVKEEGAVPAVALNARLYGFSDLQTAVRPYLELNAAASYLFGQRFLTYLSATGFLQLFGPPLFSFAVGEEFQLGRFGLQVEARWYEPDYSTRFNAIDPLSPGYQGALGLVLGLRYRFGGEGMRLFLAALLCACSLGCSLDPFVYGALRTDRYELALAGKSPLETVTAERVEELRIAVDGGVSLGAVYVRGNVQPPKAYLLFFHGKTDHLGKQFTRIKRLANCGYDVLGFDYRGWGTSSDAPITEEGLVADAVAARAALVGRSGGDERLIYYGHSFGTAVATQLAVRHPARALLLEAPFASLQAFIQDNSRLDVPQPFVAEASWDTERAIRDVHAPLLLLHGTADDFVRPEFSKALYAQANEPKTLILVEGAQHDVAAFLGAQFPGTVNGFVQEVLP